LKNNNKKNSPKSNNLLVKVSSRKLVVVLSSVLSAKRSPTLQKQSPLKSYLITRTVSSARSAKRRSKVVSTHLSSNITSTAAGALLNPVSTVYKHKSSGPQRLLAPKLQLTLLLLTLVVVIANVRSAARSVIKQKVFLSKRTYTTQTAYVAKKMAVVSYVPLTT